MKTVVFYSGGLSSFLSADIVLQDYGRDDVTLLFTDTLIEDEDLYRFLDETESALGVKITRIADGRTPWEVFHDVKMLGNSRIDPCSRILKRELAKKWVKDNCDPDNDTLIFGIGWEETHRCEAIKRNWPLSVEFPLIVEQVFDTKAEALRRLAKYNIKPPRLYSMGFHHNNCGGWCIKAGHGQFATLYKTMPERYAEHEQAEQAFRKFIDRDVAIMRERRAGVSRPMTMTEFRERLALKDNQLDLLDQGGCGCFTDQEQEGVD